eukprot:174659-Pelagomonas_calceolata.AAC.1
MGTGTRTGTGTGTRTGTGTGTCTGRDTTFFGGLWRSEQRCRFDYSINLALMAMPPLALGRPPLCSAHFHNLAKHTFMCSPGPEGGLVESFAGHPKSHNLPPWADRLLMIPLSMGF